VEGRQGEEGEEGEKGEKGEEGEAGGRGGREGRAERRERKGRASRTEPKTDEDLQKMENVQWMEADRDGGSFGIPQEWREQKTSSFSVFFLVSRLPKLAHPTYVSWSLQTILSLC
jgi:hypothetical protein